jgi:asparagine N-glycosylation enzyme membrane subunit Stt3
MSRMPARRLVFLVGLAAALAIGVGLRLSTRAQLTAGSRILPLDSDSAYHLRRARFAVAHFPRTILFDPLMNFPEGGVPIWPPLFDLALAAPSRLLHGAGAAAGAIEAEAAWVPLVFAGAAILLGGLIGRRLYGEVGGILTAFFVAICPGHILWTQFGHTDQHVAESATGLLALWAFLRSREREDGADSDALTPALSRGEKEQPSHPDPLPAGEREKTRREVVAGLALTLAVLTWQGAIYWGAIFALALFLEALLLRRDVFRPTLLVLGLPAVLTGAATAVWLGPLRPPVTYVSFGFFQPLFLGALAAGTIALEALVAAARRKLAGPDLLRRAVAIALGAAVLLPFAGDLAQGLANGVGYVMGETREVAGHGGYVSYPAGWLKGIFEARPLMADGPGLALSQLSGFFFLSPLVLAAWLVRVRRGVRPATHLALTIWGSVTLLLALTQRLNVHYAAPLTAFCLIETTRFLHAKLSGSGGPRAATRAAAGTAAAAALLLFPMARGLRQELAAIRVPGSDLFATLTRMRRELPRTVGAYDPRLLEQPPGPPSLSRARSILAPWSLGHLILYEAEQPVVANNFGYGFLDSIRFFLAENEEEALRIAGQRRAGWVIATDLVPRLNDYAGYLGRRPLLQQSAGGPEPTAAYFRTMQSRLYDFDGQGARLPGMPVPPLERFRLMYRSESAIQRGGVWLARWKVFEILPPGTGDGRR